MSDLISTGDRIAFVTMPTAKGYVTKKYRDDLLGQWLCDVLLDKPVKIEQYPSNEPVTLTFRITCLEQDLMKVRL